MKIEIPNKKSESLNLKDQFVALDQEFTEFLKELSHDPLYENTHLSTYNPLQIVKGFEPRGLQCVREIGTEEMMIDSGGMKKLLANMLSHCRPGALRDDDVEQMAGINGREMRQNL